MKRLWKIVFLAAICAFAGTQIFAEVVPVKSENSENSESSENSENSEKKAVPANLVPVATRGGVASQGVPATQNPVPAIALPKKLARPQYKMLIREHHFLGAIYVADDCDVEEIAAAQDLKEWIERVYNCKVDVLSEHRVPAKNDGGIYVGNTRAGTHILPKKSLGDSYTIAVEGSKIFIKANSVPAIWGACAEFLRRWLRVQFLMPGDDGAEWEPLINFVLIDSRHDIVPAWHWRGAGSLGLWGKHLGFGQLPRFSHNLHNIFTNKIYRENPELIAICAGEKARFRESGRAPQPNFTCEKAVPVAVEAAQKFFAENPDAFSFSLGINDNVFWDESPKSLEKTGVPVKFFRNLPVRSNLYFDFANRVAESVPERYFGCLAYNEVQQNPAFPLAKNLVPVLCTDRGQWFHENYRSRDLELFENWGKIAKIWGLWEYYEGSPFLFPREFYAAQIEAVEKAYANGARLMMVEGADPSGIDCFKAWLLARALEVSGTNKKIDLDAEMKNYCQLAFGPAGDAMVEFFRECEAIWSRQTTHERWLAGWRAESASEIFRKKDWQNLANCLAKARQAFPQKIKRSRPQRELARFERIEREFRRYRAFSESYYARKNLLNAPLNTLDQIAAALRLPAWNYEKIYDPAAFPREIYKPHQLWTSDPRPTKFLEILHALVAFPLDEKRLKIERDLQKLLERSPIRNLLENLARQIPRTPIIAEDFEFVAGKFDANGEPAGILQDALPQIDWREGKKIAFPRGWQKILYPAEFLTADLTQAEGEVFAGTNAYKIAGTPDSIGFAREIDVEPGESVMFSAQVKSRLSICADVQISIFWVDANGRTIGENLVAVPVGEISKWRQFFAAGTVPALARRAYLRIMCAYFATGDFLILDDIEARKWK